MSIKVNDLKNLEVCEKSFILNKSIISIKDQYYYMAIGIKNAIINALKSKNYKEEFIRDTLDESMPDDVFLPLVKETNINLLTVSIIKYLQYLQREKFELIESNITEDINVGGELVSVSADLILKDADNAIHVVKLKRSAPKLSYRGRKYESIPRNNIELYLLKKLGDKKYSESLIYGSFHHMEGKNDKKGDYPFESKKGYNVINCSFDSEDGIKETVEKLIKKSQGVDFKQTEDKNNCRNCAFQNVCNYKKPTKIELEEVKKEMKAPSSFNLTKSQRSAVLFDKGIARINAGAGSGKTTVVALRVNELILNGCEPKDILMTTFTNKGAEEMRDKVKYWLEKEGLDIENDELNITTFNAWGDNIIKENFKELGFKREPSLVDKVEKYDILFNILSNNPKIESLDYKNPIMNFRYAQGAVAKLDKVFSYIKANNVTNETGLLKLVKEFDDATKILKMYKEYSKILKERGLIEYQDQINMVMELMEEDNPIIKKYDYKHIITDEFQDTDAIQIDLIMYLSNQPSFESLMVVGDDSQSIFSFRNTTQENILNFHKLFNKVKDIQIVENFRSTPEIVDLANYLNSLNKNKIEKKLISGNKNGQKPVLISYDTSEEEHEDIVRKIKELIDSGEKEENIAVIARTKYELFDIQKKLELLGIPHVLDIPEPIINNIKIHMSKNLAEFLNDTSITQGLYEYLMILTDNFEDMTENEIKSLLKEEAENIKETLKENRDDEDLKLLDLVKRDLFFTMIELIEDKELERFIKDIKEKDMTFKELQKYLRKFIEYEDPKTVDKEEKKYRAVTLTTAHTSKGKEFKVVFNTITKYLPDRKEEAIDEERRLLFVSITRAKESLYITYVEPGKNSFSKRYTGFPNELFLTDTTKRMMSL